MKHLLLLLTIAAALSLVACGRRETPGTAINPADAEQLVASGVPEIRNVGFGGKFTLLGVTSRPAGDGLLFELAWQANGKQKLDYLVPVHALDASGGIVGQVDFRQDEKRRVVADGAMWRDDVIIPRETLVGAVSIGFGLMDDGGTWLPVDRGPRDQDLLRLLLPVPPEFTAPAAPTPFDGYLEVVNDSEIIGWVWRNDDPGQVIEVEIYDGDTLLGRVRADVMRADLQSAGIGDGQHGFRMETPPEIRDSRPHRIAVRVTGTGFELHRSPKTYLWKK